MASRSNQVKLDSPTSRKRLPARDAKHWNVIAPGCYLGYRRSTATKAGTWYLKFVPAQDEALVRDRIQEALAAADDFMPADGVIAWSYEQVREKAENWFRTAKQKCTGEIQVPRGKRHRYTVSDACADYLHSKQGRTDYLYETTRMVESNIIPRLGDIPVDRLTRAHIDDWMHYLATSRRRKPRNGLDPKSEEALRCSKDTANRNLRVLKAVLNHSLGKVACSDLAWKMAKQFSNVAQNRTRFLTDAEAQKLVDACFPAFRVLVLGALFSGCRKSELARLQVCDFEPISCTLFVSRSKGAKPRRIYLDAEAGAFFTKLCAKRKGNDLMFQLNGAAWGKDSAQGMMAEATKAAEIEPLTFHELRHTAASRWARLGLSLAEIAAQLGHADVRMTQRYAHLCQQTLANKIRSMPAMGIYREDERPAVVN
ncbi:MAG: site-specific integrase [Acidobacteriales bacterium]|nr:site-specific integrase [Terriglobales bacterium]